SARVVAYVTRSSPPLTSLRHETSTDDIDIAGNVFVVMLVHHCVANRLIGVVVLLRCECPEADELPDEYSCCTPCTIGRDGIEKLIFNPVHCLGEAVSRRGSTASFRPTRSCRPGGSDP